MTETWACVRFRSCKGRFERVCLHVLLCFFCLLCAACLHCNVSQWCAPLPDVQGSLPERTCQTPAVQRIRPHRNHLAALGRACSAMAMTSTVYTGPSAGSRSLLGVAGSPHAQMPQSPIAAVPDMSGALPSPTGTRAVVDIALNYKSGSWPLAITSVSDKVFARSGSLHDWAS